MRMERLEAAAGAFAALMGGGPVEPLDRKCSAEILDAVDAVMSSNEGLWNIAKAIRDSDWPDYEDQLHHPVKDYVSNARAVIAALAGDRNE